MRWYSMSIDHDESFTFLFYAGGFIPPALSMNSDYLVRSIEDIDGK